MKRLVLGALFAVLLGFSLTGWAVQFPVTVTGVEIEGTVKIHKRDVLDAIEFSAGDVVAEDDLRAASQAIFDLGWFGEVQPNVTDEGVITFRVAENPVVQEIVITGNDNRKDYTLFGLKLFDTRIMPTSVIRRILRENDVRKGKVLNRAGLEAGLSEVITEYNDRGYVLVALGNVEIGETLRIEFVEAHVVANTITGLNTVPIELAEELIDLPLGVPLERTDVQKVMSALNQSVFFSNVEVVPQAGPTPDSVILKWELEERVILEAPASLSGIRLAGITRYDQETVEAELGDLPEGTIDNYGLLQVLEGVYDLYVDAGFMMVRFTVAPVEDGTLPVRIDEGRVGDIVVSGLSRTQEYVVLRNLDIEVGRVLTRADLLATYQALSALGYFGVVDPVPEWTDEGFVRVTITLTEKERLGGLQGTMSIDPSGGGLVGELSLNQKNLFGTGQDIELSYSRGLADGSGNPPTSTWNLGYSSVAFFRGFDRVGVDFYRRRTSLVTTEDTYEVTTLGGGLTFAYPFDDYLSLGLGYRHEQERIAGLSRWTPTDSFTLSLTYNDVADPWFPQQGSRRAISLEKAGGFSTSREYANLGLTWIQFRPASFFLFERFDQAVAARVKVGLGDRLLPSTKYYELGGPMSIRGVEASSVPRMVLINTEYRLQLVEDALLLSAFLDAGTDLDAVSSESLLSSTGLEMGVSAAGMFIRLDLAWVLTAEWNWTPRFEFGFSRMF